MPMFLNINPEECGTTIVCHDGMPAGGEWIELDAAVAIVREHNDREARREQAPDWILDVADELRRARAKFPGTDLLTTAFAEEAGELVKAILDGYNGKPSDIYTEAIQTIAMVVRLLEEGDPVHRLKPIAPIKRQVIDGTTHSSAAWVAAASQLGKTETTFRSVEEWANAHITPNVTPDPTGEGSAYIGEPASVAPDASKGMCHVVHTRGTSEGDMAETECGHYLVRPWHSGQAFSDSWPICPGCGKILCDRVPARGDSEPARLPGAAGLAEKVQEIQAGAESHNRALVDDDVVRVPPGFDTTEGNLFELLLRAAHFYNENTSVGRIAKQIREKRAAQSGAA